MTKRTGIYLILGRVAAVVMWLACYARWLKPTLSAPTIPRAVNDNWHPGSAA